MEKITDFLIRRSPRFYVTVSVLWVIGIGVLDAKTDYRLRLSPLYLPALFLIAWFTTLRASLVMAFGTTMIWIGANRLNQNPSLVAGYLPWNVLVLFFSYASFAFVVGSLRTQTSNAGRDALTHLANRRTLDHYLHREIERCRRTGKPLTVGYIDVDDFKSVNDRFGHQTGDQLLQSIGRTIEEHIRPTDLAVRFGGDEFGVVISEAVPEAARKTFEALRTRLIQTVVVRDCPVTFSIGVATFPTPPNSSADILKHADDLMYSVKRQGKNHLEYREINDKSSMPGRYCASR